MARTEWAQRQQKKAIIAAVLMVAAILDGVFAMPTRNAFAAFFLLSCVGLSVGLLMHVWVSYVHKWVLESEVDPYSRW